MKTRDHHQAARSGFSLVEVTLALGVAAFCLVVLLGLIPAGVNSDQASLEQTAAAGIAAAVVADLRATAKANGAASPRFGLKITDAAGSAAGKLDSPETIYLAEDGSATGSVGAAPVTAAGASVSRYRVSLAFVPPPASSGSGATSATLAPTGVRLLITWPALADSDPAKAPAKYANSLEAVTALDRN